MGSPFWSTILPLSDLVCAEVEILRTKAAAQRIAFIKKVFLIALVVVNKYLVAIKEITCQGGETEYKIKKFIEKNNEFVGVDIITNFAASYQIRGIPDGQSGQKP